ncbi:SDR family NAD(P)-dependent oxidoreductase [Caulobacter sp. KR2-114]|uniref:SDR family NAD(P)-dependent oxidoreductase n=1 Tax=Caulobacter sp. KR2-114 TaxID=3400912 RepID=UPI003C0E051E
MTAQHPAITAGRTAVITGAASGIGLATGVRLAGLGLNVVLADVPSAPLNYAASAVLAAAAHGAQVEAIATDVSDHAQVEALRDATLKRFGDVALLMNNAGVGRGGSAYENLDGWRRILAVNLMGVLHGTQAFTQAMLDLGRPAAIVNTGSKQGITMPPGDTAYNASKAGIKALTEGLQHSLRNVAGSQVTAHLLVPGFTFTGMTRPGAGEKPPGAWTGEQVADFMLARMAAGDFYIICPDNDVTREIDNARMTWTMQDITQGRPPLSRWHPDYADAFAAFLKDETGPKDETGG